MSLLDSPNYSQPDTGRLDASVSQTVMQVEGYLIPVFHEIHSPAGNTLSDTVLERLQTWVRFPMIASGFWKFYVMPYMVYTMVYTSMVYHSFMWYITHQYDLVYIIVYHISESWNITCVISHMRYITWYIPWYIGISFTMIYWYMTWYIS